MKRSGRKKMKSKFKKFLSMLMTAVMAFTVLTFSFANTTASAAWDWWNVWGGWERRDTEPYGEIQPYEVKSGNKVHQGYILTPKAPGTYPVVVLFCGRTGHRWKENQDFSMKARMNTWVSKGYIKPMIIIMPTLVMNDRDNTNLNSDLFFLYIRNKMGGLKNAFLSDKTFGKYFDPGETWSVSGYSMGGAAALYAGCLYRNLYVNVGSFSPSESLYYEEGGTGWINRASDLVFSKSSNAHLFMGYSVKERAEFARYVKKYDKLFKKNGFNFKIYVSPEGNHGTMLFRRQMLSFFYYISNNVFLTDDIIFTMKY